MKRKSKFRPSNDYRLLERLSMESPTEFSIAAVHSSNVMDEVEKNIRALEHESDLTYMIYWLQLSVQVNLIVDGLFNRSSEQIDYLINREELRTRKITPTI